MIAAVAIIVVSLASWAAYRAFVSRPTELPKESPEEKQVSPLPAAGEITPTDETANWEVYRNEEYGFEVKYPGDWSIDKTRSELPGLVVFDIGIEESYESITSEENIHNVDLERWPDMLLDKRVIRSQSVFQVAGEKALRLDTAEFGQIIIVALHKNYVYIFTTGGKMIEEGILSTFKFLD